MSQTFAKGVETLILAALCDLYERLLADPDSGVARPGYCESSAVAALEISTDGHLVRAVPLGSQKGKSIAGLKMKVPDRPKRAAGDDPSFLCDNIEYILGARPGTHEADWRATRRHDLSRTLHERVLADSDDAGARAVLAFLREWKPEDFVGNPRLADALEALDTGRSMVFRLEGDDRFVHERPNVMDVWEAYAASASERTVYGQCLVTGKMGPIARLHKSISGVRDAQSTGASVVSFNFRAAESYGKEQGDNSPVGEAAAFAYGTALNWLTASERHHILAGDSTIVFWAERAGPEENLLLDLFGLAVGAYGKDEQGDREGQPAVSNDEGGAGQVHSVLERIIRGRPIAEEELVFDAGVRFYMLGLAPNAARVSIRFWRVDTFGGFVENVRKHFEDMAIVHSKNERPLSVGRLLLEMAPAVSRKRDSIPKVLVGSLMRSILEGRAYPQSAYATIIGRMRVDANNPDQPRLERKVTYPRAAYVKAHLRRKARITGDRALEEALTEMLNTENRNPGYLLGRLFALLEKAQQDANPGINATIKDRYYASASATPGTVFPVLIRLAQHHMAKSQYGKSMDKRVQEVMEAIDAFPAHLNLDQQGLFALGYYQQKSALYTKADSSTGKVES